MQVKASPLRRFATPGLAAAVGTGMLSAGATFHTQLQDAFTAIEPTTLLLAALLTLVYRILNAANWSLVLRSVGAHMNRLQATRIWMTSEACRWLPGSLWSYGSRGVQASSCGVPGPLAALSLPVELVLTIVAWLMTSVFLLPYADILTSVVPAIRLPNSVTFGFLLIVTLIIVGVVAGWIFRTRCPRMAERWQHLRRVRLSGKHLIAAQLNYVVLCLVNGLALFVAVQSLRPTTSVPVSVVVGANAVAWLIGFCAFMAPGGLLVREGTLATLLACWLPLELAVIASVLFRVLQLGVEVVCLGTILLARTAAVSQFCHRFVTLRQPAPATSTERP